MLHQLHHLRSGHFKLQQFLLKSFLDLLFPPLPPVPPPLPPIPPHIPPLPSLLPQPDPYPKYGLRHDDRPRCRHSSISGSSPSSFPFFLSFPLFSSPSVYLSLSASFPPKLPFPPISSTANTSHHSQGRAGFVALRKYRGTTAGATMLGKAYYKGGFEARISRREATLILGLK